MKTVVTRGHDGWVVEWAHGQGSQFLGDSGGLWNLKPDGTLGRQLIGTCDIRVSKRPMDVAVMVSKLAGYEGEEIEVQ